MPICSRIDRKRRIVSSFAIWLMIPAFFLSSSSSYAQQIDDSQTQSKAIVLDKNTSANGAQNSVKSLVSLTVKDSSIRYVVHALVNQAEMKVVYDTDNPYLSKRVNVSVSKMPILEAMKTVLKGTGLYAVVTSNGGTIAIRTVIDSTELKSRSSGEAKGHIAGRITDSATGHGIGGVVLSIRGTRVAITTKSDGTYRLEVVAGNHIIDVKSLGYTSKSQQVSVQSGKLSSISFVMTPSAATLDGVVTTAVGKQRRAEIPNDIVKIEADKIRERSPVRNVIDLIEAAQVPGVLIQHSNGDPGSPSRIRIRGIGSISQSNDPVMIVDGVWIDAKTSYPSRLDNIDPASIETIEIVRGPSAATLYGQDASNGVIVITTKKGKAGPSRWNLSYKRDWGQTYGKKPLEYAGVGTSHATTMQTVCSIREVQDYTCTQDTVLVYDPNNPLVSKEGVETNNKYMAQLDGGGQNISYMFTFSTSNTIGVRRNSEIETIRQRIVGFQTPSDFLKPSALDRNTITSNVVLNSRRNLTLSMMVTGTQTNLKDNSISTKWTGFPKSPVITNQYSIDTIFSSSTKGAIGMRESPYKTLSGLISGSVQYNPLEAIQVNANIGAEKTYGNNSWYSRSFDCLIVSGCVEKLGTRFESSESGSVHTLRLNASVNLSLGPLNRFLSIRPSIGGDYRKTDQTRTSINKNDIPVGDRSLTGGTLMSADNTIQENALAGWYLNSTIGIFRRIYFDVGLRQDIGSAITSSKNATYPKIGGSWLVSDEGFWKRNLFITNLRLRSAIGHSAVQPDVNDIDGRFTNGVEFIDGVFVNTVNLAGIGNSILRPERAVELEVGFDMDLLSDRINLVGTYAHKENKNTLVVRPLPGSFGTDVGTQSGNRKENVASVRNRNFEFSANGRAIETSNMLLVLNYNLTLSDNKVMSLGDGIAPFGRSDSRVEAGYPLGASWGKKVLGYDDINGDGMLSVNELITADSMVYKGWSQPRYRAGYGISLTLANQVVLDSRFAYQSRYVQQYKYQTMRGTEDIHSTLPEQAAAILREVHVQQPISDLRWNSASITYNLPNSILKKIGSRSIAISLQGRNLGLWTNYIGKDPGINSSLANELSSDDGTTSSQPRLYVLDFRIGF